MAGTKKPTKNTTQTETNRTPEEMAIINARSELIAEQRRFQLEQMDCLGVRILETKTIVSPRFLELVIFLHVKIPGIEELFYQDWETVYTMAKKEVYVPIVKEFFNCATVERSELDSTTTLRLSLFKILLMLWKSLLTLEKGIPSIGKLVAKMLITSGRTAMNLFEWR